MARLEKKSAYGERLFTRFLYMPYVDSTDMLVYRNGLGGRISQLGGWAR